MAQSNNLKLKDYFKQAENVIENNLKIFMPCILIFVMVSAFVSQINVSELSVSDSEAISNINIEAFSNSGIDEKVLINEVTNIVTFIIIFRILMFIFLLLEIFILLKAKTGLDIVEDKREKGNVLVKIGRLILANIIFYFAKLGISIILTTILVMVFNLNAALAILVSIALYIPLIMLIIVAIIMQQGLTFEIIVKNTKVIESYKLAYKNVMKSTNKTLSKILVGMGVQTLAFMTIQYISSANNNITIVVGSALQAACLVYFLVYYLIIYMSSEV